MQIEDGALSAATKMQPTDPVSTVMTKSVVVANHGHKFSSVIELFSKYDMHHLPIVDDDSKIIGILSSNDLMKVFTDPKYKNVTLTSGDTDNHINILDIMTPHVITVSPNDTLKHAAKLFTDNHIMAMPVLENGQMVGIITVRDLVQLIAYFS